MEFEFGWDRVSRGMHFKVTVMVLLGSVFSSNWIVVADSSMQKGAGDDPTYHQWQYPHPPCVIGAYVQTIRVAGRRH